MLLIAVAPPAVYTAPKAPRYEAVANRIDLSLAELDAHDQRPIVHGDERRYLCPLPACQAKTHTASHRCFCVNTESGVYICHRCQAKGLLTDKRTFVKRDPRARLREAFSFRPEPQKGRAPTAALLPGMLDGTVPLEGTPGAEYLAARGIDPRAAHECGALYHQSWFGRPAVVFPGRDDKGEVVVGVGRYVDGREEAGEAKVRTAGELRFGVFATPGAWKATPVVLVEGGIDAIALHMAGIPAVALQHTGWPHWLRWKLGLKRVALSLDSDEAGDEASVRLASELRRYGATVVRWRIPNAPGVKDWGDVAKEYGTGEVRSLVAVFASSYTAAGSGVWSGWSAPAAAVPPAVPTAPEADYQEAAGVSGGRENGAPTARPSPPGPPAWPARDDGDDDWGTLPAENGGDATAAVAAGAPAVRTAPPRSEAAVADDGGGR